VSQTVFVNKLTSELQNNFPAMSASAVINAGAYDLRKLFSLSKDLDVLRSAYQVAVRDLFVFLLVTSALAFVASFGFEHKNLRLIEQERKEETESRAYHKLLLQCQACFRI
jgi:hypothetical protein